MNLVTRKIITISSTQSHQRSKKDIIFPEYTGSTEPATSKTIEITKIFGFLESYIKFLCNAGASIFSLQALNIWQTFGEAGILKGCSTLSWWSLTVPFFCILHVQFGQYIVSSQDKDSFLPKWLALLYWKQTVKLYMEVFDASHPFLK